MRTSTANNRLVSVCSLALVIIGLQAPMQRGEAGQFHVSPIGTPGGNGSRSSPWDLQTALNQPAAVQPGDTIWIHGGLYSGIFRSYLNGTPARPIVVRQFPGERPILDNVAGVKDFGLALTGSNTWFWGFEVRNTSPSIWNISGVAMAGPGQKLINMLVHDNLATGITSFSAAADAEVYGCLIYYNGRETEDPTNRGYGIYTQNDAGRVKAFKENIIPYSWGFGVHAYTEGNKIDDFLWEGNVIFNSGILWRGIQYERNFFIGSATVVADSNTFRDNHSYFPATPTDGARNTFGYFAGTTNLLVTGNWFIGGAFDVSGVNPVVTGNTFYRTNGFNGPGNTYLNSPQGTNVFVRPNAYERGRANIVVYNWSLNNSVTVDVSGAGLTAGERYEVRDALNWFGPLVATGTYTGVPITLPMTGLSVATPVGIPAIAPKHTAPEFAVFQIMPFTASAPAPAGSLTTSPDTLPIGGGTATLNWTSSNAEGAAIDQGVGAVALNGTRTLQVPSSRTFTLTLTGPGGTASYSSRVVVRGPVSPPTGSITVSPDTLPAGGGTATLTWTSQNADSAGIDQGIGQVVLNGTRSVPVTGTTTFTLSLRGPGGTATYSARVVVRTFVPPPTGSFTANPDTLPIGGGNTTLSWTSQNATAASIDQGIGTVAISGSRTVPVTATRTFTLTLTGPGGTARYTARVGVRLPVLSPIGSFSASPDTLPIGGGNATLSWTSQNADTARIDNGIGTVSLSGARTIALTATTTYTLTLIGPGGTTAYAARVVVRSPNPPPTGTFSGSPDTLPIGGGTVTLNWASQNAAGASIDQGIGNVAVNGTRSVTVASTRTFTLTLTGAGGTASYTVRVVVRVAAPPPTGSFTVTPDTLPAGGGTVTLVWASQNAVSATIDQGIGPVPLSGTTTAFVTVTRTFTFALTGPGGEATYRDRVGVRVNPPVIIPRDFALEQNYPNPFNPNTKILVKAPFGTNVTLIVHDLLGNEVARLLDGPLAAGTYAVEFSGRGLSSGIYFYTLRMNGFVDVKKMILLR